VTCHCNGLDAGLATQLSLVREPALRFHLTTLGQLLAYVCLGHQAVLFGTGHGRWYPRGGKVTVSSGVIVAMHHRLQWLIHLRTHSLRKGVEQCSTPPRLLMRYSTLYLYLYARTHWQNINLPRTTMRKYMQSSKNY